MSGLIAFQAQKYHLPEIHGFHAPADYKDA
jgi:hypothetical protein